MVAVGGDDVGGSFDVVIGVPHCDAETGSIYHGDVIVIVTDGYGFFDGNAEQIADLAQSESLIDSGSAYFQRRVFRENTIDREIPEPFHSSFSGFRVVW